MKRASIEVAWAKHQEGRRSNPAFGHMVPAYIHGSCIHVVHVYLERGWGEAHPVTCIMKLITSFGGRLMKPLFVDDSAKHSPGMWLKQREREDIK